MQRFNFNRKATGNALVWAAVMLASALLIQDSENSHLMLLLMVSGWFVTHGLVDRKNGRTCEEWSG